MLRELELYFFMWSSQMSAISLKLWSCYERAEEWQGKKARHAFPLTGVFVSPPVPSPIVVRHSLDGRLANESVHTLTTTELALHFAFHYYCLYLPTSYINTSSIPPRNTRQPLRPTISTRADSFTKDAHHSRKRHRRQRRMLSPFPLADHSHSAAVHFYHQTDTFQLEVEGSPTQAAGFETAGRDVSLLPASRPLRAFLFTILEHTSHSAKPLG
ncbi:hypothetical protein DFH08DRAFT_970306 [Mycena albidolilacea]|uniref:Uncharacterized protein n=1 Tax=Mycena albidolilacea TaxID=1033008 RepID=A0AAD7EH56_9AGAR|nr:hypothetical protein DFH08DRAFT_970306 [Mycena albidolilacea]